MRAIALVDHTKKHRPGRGVLSAMARALTIQIARDFAPAWGIAPVRVSVGGRGEKVHFFDTSHDREAFGYHDVDPKGRPYAHVDVGLSFLAESDWLTGTDAVSTSASHEVLEMLVDPTGCEYSFNNRRTLWAHEVCDAVQENVYSIVVGKKRVAVSDFVLPAFFNPWARKGPFDHLRVLDAAFTLAKGGYAMCERARADYDKDGKRFGVTFERSVPAWRRKQKLDGFGRTYWRMVLSGSLEPRRPTS